MFSVDIDLQVQLASRAKTKVKTRGTRGICDLSFDEIRALAFVADVLLADYPGPLTRGNPDLALPRPNLTQETT